MSLVSRLFSGCLIVLTLAVFGAVVVGYAIYRFSDTGSVRGAWSEPLAGATAIQASIDVDNGQVSIADSLPAGPTVPGDVAFRTEYRVGAGNPIARNWLRDGNTGIATLGSEPVHLPLAALRWLHSPEQASWDIGLNPQVPVILNVNVAVGSAQLDLTGVTTTRFSVNVAVGDADIVVGNADAASGTSRIRVGVGDGRLVVPAEVPVRIQVTAGISDIDRADGFLFDGLYYINDAWMNRTDPTTGMDIVVETGTGSVSLATLVPATPGPVELVPSEPTDPPRARTSRLPAASIPAWPRSAPIERTNPARPEASSRNSSATTSPPPVDSPADDRRP